MSKRYDIRRIPSQDPKGDYWIVGQGCMSDFDPVKNAVHREAARLGLGDLVANSWAPAGSGNRMEYRACFEKGK